MEHPGNIQLPQLPFVTREMLKFGPEATIELRVRVRSTRTSAFTVRGMSRNGVFAFGLTTTGVGNTLSEDFRVSDIPTFVTVQSNVTTIEQGEIFVEVTLLVNASPVAILCAGYIYGIHSIGFPGPNTPDSRPGGGVINVIESADPAAGTELTDTVNANEVWRIQSIALTLVTDANAADRRVHISITDGANEIFRTFTAIEQVASTTRGYIFAHQVAVADREDNGIILVPLSAPLLIPNPFVISTVTTNIQVGDDFGVMRILVERFIA